MFLITVPANFLAACWLSSAWNAAASGEGPKEEEKEEQKEKEGSIHFWMNAEAMAFHPLKVLEHYKNIVKNTWLNK
jgi:hypothetical protein